MNTDREKHTGCDLNTVKCEQFGHWDSKHFSTYMRVGH